MIRSALRRPQRKRATSFSSGSSLSGSTSELVPGGEMSPLSASPRTSGLAGPGGDSEGPKIMLMPLTAAAAVATSVVVAPSGSLGQGGANSDLDSVREQKLAEAVAAFMNLAGDIANGRK